MSRKISQFIILKLIYGLLCIQVVCPFPNQVNFHDLFMNSHVEGEDLSKLKIAKREESDAEALEDYKDNCGHSHNMKEVNSVKFVTPFYGTGKPYAPSITCKNLFIGDKSCQPEVTCTTFELAESEDCSDEYLEISDGIGGQEKLCGKKAFDKPFKPTKGARDLYVVLQTGDTAGTGKGISCEARCSKNIGEAKELSPVEDSRKENFQCVCGLRNQDDRIVGGQDVDSASEFPWQAAIVYAGTRKPKCGAALINDRYILTAAHCFVFDDTEAADIEILLHAKLLDATLLSGHRDVRLGLKGSIRAPGYKEDKVTDEQEGTQRYKVAQVITHGLFSEKYDYDVALIKLEEKIDLSGANAPTPLCLPKVPDYTSTYEGQNATVVGWGMAHESAGGTTRMLQKLDVPVLNMEKCRKWIEFTLTDRMLCAGYEEGVHDACTGDSGGPLAHQKENKQWEQIGIVSWGEGCARKQRPGFYSRVTDLNQWIQYHTKGATWCRDSKSIDD